MCSFGVPLNELEASQCLKYFDTNKDGKISFTEFLGAVRGEMNQTRRDAVH
jgi:Ca2+-binding EF-hand superfamily protein